MFETILEITGTAIKLITTITGAVTLTQSAVKSISKSIRKKRYKNMLEIEYYGETYHVKTQIGYYPNGNIAISLFDPKEGPFATITKNVTDLPAGQACIDTNNDPWAEDFIKKYNLGKPLGYSIPSGYCRYPVYELNLEEIKKHM